MAEGDPEHLQLAFDLLTALIDRVGLKTNTLKTKAMIFLPRTSLSGEPYLGIMDPAAWTTIAA